MADLGHDWLLTIGTTIDRAWHRLTRRRPWGLAVTLMLARQAFSYASAPTIAARYFDAVFAIFQVALAVCVAASRGTSDRDEGDGAAAGQASILGRLALAYAFTFWLQAFIFAIVVGELLHAPTRPRLWLACGDACSLVSAALVVVLARGPRSPGRPRRRTLQRRQQLPAL